MDIIDPKVFSVIGIGKKIERPAPVLKKICHYTQRSGDIIILLTTPNYADPHCSSEERLIVMSLGLDIG